MSQRVFKRDAAQITGATGLRDIEYVNPVGSSSQVGVVSTYREVKRLPSVGELDVANRFDGREITERDDFKCSEDRVGRLALRVEAPAVENVSVITLCLDCDDLDLV